jgi:hypothetical protein
MSPPIDKAVKRLQDAVGRGSPTKEMSPMGHVDLRDLEVLLRDWRRLDGESRMMYKPHHDLLADRVKKLDEAMKETQRALEVLRSPADFVIHEIPARRGSWRYGY